MEWQDAQPFARMTAFASVNCLDFLLRYPIVEIVTVHDGDVRIHLGVVLTAILCTNDVL